MPPMLRVLVAATVIIASHAGAAMASPTMIRLGYRDCVSCHVSPQGGGLLTPYGKGIDEAQSLRAREIPQAEGPGPRLLYDVRFVAAAQLAASHATGTRSTASTFRAQLRSALNLNERHRLNYAVGLESPTLSSTNRAVGASTAAAVVVPKVLWEYQAKESLQLAVGRDEMPSGIGLPDPLTFMRRGSDPGNTGYPTQVKAFWRNERVEITPYLFGPGGDEAANMQQYGAGVVAGVDVWKQRAVLGITARSAHALKEAGLDRRSIGAFARLGFGAWGILAEHDVSSRTAESVASTRYLAGHTQVFFAPVEWLVASLGAEHLVVDGPRASHVYRFAPGIQARLSNNLTLIFNTRDVFTGAEAGRTRTYSLQIAVKSVQ
jgi:hypothetical protein